MYNQVSAVAKYAGQFMVDEIERPKWAMMDVDLGRKDSHIFIPAFIEDPKVIKEMQKYLNDYNVNRKIWFEGSIESDVGSLVFFVRKLLLLEKFYTMEELQRYKQGKVDFSEE